MRALFLLLLLLSCQLCLGFSTAYGQEVAGCGTLENAFGPFDYTDPAARQESLPVVEKFHFTREVESLRAGTTGPVIGDIDYTLRAFPNHHRALGAVARYAIRGGKFPATAIPSAECYFLRAVAFRPDDPTVRTLFGNYLFKRGDRSAAGVQYEEALQLAPASPEISYNAGLFFLEIGDLVRAKALAKVAYDEGYPLPGLKKKIAAAEAARSKP